MIGLRDPTGRLKIGPPNDDHTQLLFAAGATSIIYGRRGEFRGCYVDNETPNRDVVARWLANAAVGLIVVGLYPSEAGHKIEGCVCALEWYPFGGGYSSVPLPKADAYITQWAFAWPGFKPPTRRQRLKLYARAWLRRPKLVWVY